MTLHDSAICRMGTMHCILYLRTSIFRSSSHLLYYIDTYIYIYIYYLTYTTRRCASNESTRTDEQKTKPATTGDDWTDGQKTRDNRRRNGRTKPGRRPTTERTEDDDGNDGTQQENECNIDTFPIKWLPWIKLRSSPIVADGCANTSLYKEASQMKRMP